MLDQTNEIISIFQKSLNPDIKYANVTIRKAAKDLIARYKYEGVHKMATRVVKSQLSYNNRLENGDLEDGEPICPTAITPYEMMVKIPKFARYFAELKSKERKRERKKAFKPVTPDFVKQRGEIDPEMRARTDAVKESIRNKFKK